ncbi:MAG: hypothetical protein C0615_02820 [Desulfuromonas sp.]|nr:MAG: hypothetical protein C0615_02820 [Desulfuromonas sp.]
MKIPFISNVVKVSKRRVVQTSSLFISNAFVLSSLNFIPCGFLQCSNCALSTFACPLILVQRGAVLASMGMFGMMSDKIVASVGSALAMLVLFGAVFGTWACGWLCPFGFIQDLLAKVPVKKIRMPEWSGHLRIPLFILLVTLIPYWTRSLFFCDVCPPGAINRLWQQALGIPLFFKSPEGIMAVVSIGLLVAVIAAAIFIQRPFCSLLCPIGGLHGLFNKISGFFLNVESESCSACKQCQAACTQGINPVATPANSLCSRCLACTDSCEYINLDIKL